MTTTSSPLTVAFPFLVVLDILCHQVLEAQISFIRDSLAFGLIEEFGDKSLMTTRSGKT
jgi:hypothetical protein